MSGDGAGFEYVVAWRARRDARHLAGDSDARPDALDDRLRDILQPERLTQARARAHSAAEGREGEADRSSLRLLIEPFLEGAAAEAARELARARSEREPAGGFCAAIAGDADPAGRIGIEGEWRRAEAALERRRRELRDVLDAAAGSVGSSSRFELHALTAPIPPTVTVEAVKRAAIEPLDAAIAAAAADRRARFRPRLPAHADPGDTVLLARMTDHRESLGASGVARRVRVAARALDLDPDGRGPALLETPARLEAAEALEWIEPRAAFLAGRLEGPVGLAGALEALGRASRAGSIRRTRGGIAAASSDPAFAAASGLLLRRLVLSARFFEWAEIGGDDAVRADLRFEESVSIRLAWARTDLASRGIAGADPRVEESLARAGGRPASTDLVVSTWDADATGAATLRGAAFAVLLEERLRTRSGHLWFQDPRSPRFLREVWDAEDGLTAESVADALDLGTMDALLLYDGYRC